MLKLNEKGLTLVELLAVIIISSFIMILATSLIVQAMKSQEKTTAENQLRDEADIMMSMLMKDIFTLKESEIDRVECGTITDDTTVVTVPCTSETDNLSDSDAANVALAKQTMTACKLLNEDPDIIPVDPAATHEPKCSTFAFIYLKDGKKIGLQLSEVITKNGSHTMVHEVITRNGDYKMVGKNITLNPYYTIEQKLSSYNRSGKAGQSVSIIVTFQLTNDAKKISQSFQNEIITVDDQ